MGVLAFLESLVLIGLFVPAIATMIVVGGLIGTGMIDPVPVIICAVIGAVLGDWASYALGHVLGPSIYRYRWLRRHRLALARARLFFRRFGFASVLLGRFLGPVRSTIPVVAGVLKMPLMSFQAANILSAFVWVFALLAPGYLAGNRVVEMGLQTEHILMLIAVLSILPLVMGVITIRLFGKPRRPSSTPIA